MFKQRTSHSSPKTSMYYENQKLCNSGTVFHFTFPVMANPASLYFCDTKHYNTEICVHEICVHNIWY